LWSRVSSTLTAAKVPAPTSALLEEASEALAKATGRQAKQLRADVGAALAAITK